MLNKANIPWSAKVLTNQVNKENVKFDVSVQRGYVWDCYKKSLLIHSMMVGFPIPPMYFSKKNGVYQALDGKQRSNAISSYLNDKFALSLRTPCVSMEGEDVEVAGKKFSELPEILQDAIKDYSLTIYYFEDITDEEVSELFFRINNGKPLSATELTRVKAKDLVSFQQIASHDMIQKSITDKGRERYNDEQIAMQVWGMICVPGICFNTSKFRPIIETTKVKQEEIAQCKAALDYVFTAYNRLNSKDKSEKRIMKKISTKTNLVFAAYLADTAIANKVSVDDYTDLVHSFFNSDKTSVDDEYNESVKVSSGSADSIMCRQEIAYKMIKDLLEEQKKEEEENAEYEW